MSSRKNSRIFQNTSVPDIAKSLFREHGFSDFEDALSQTYASREFVVQYQESDFNFVSRLLERAGIYYFFRHEEGRHVLVLADSSTASQMVAPYEDVIFHPEGSPTPLAGEHINSWSWRTSGVRARTRATTSTSSGRARASSRSFTPRPVHKRGDLEIYDHPGGFLGAKEGEAYVRQRLEALQSDVELATPPATCAASDAETVRPVSASRSEQPEQDVPDCLGDVRRRQQPPPDRKR
jgi:type VI secretion system secreted protein VgrG